MALLNYPILGEIENFRIGVITSTDWKMYAPIFSTQPIKVGDKTYNRCTIVLYQEIKE